MFDEEDDYLLPIDKWRMVGDGQGRYAMERFHPIMNKYVLVTTYKKFDSAKLADDYYIAKWMNSVTPTGEPMADYWLNCAECAGKTGVINGYRQCVRVLYSLS